MAVAFIVIVVLNEMGDYFGNSNTLNRRSCTSINRQHGKIVVARQVKKCPAVYGTLAYLTVLTRLHHWTLAKAN
jgi:hypothetical protein